MNTKFFWVFWTVAFCPIEFFELFFISLIQTLNILVMTSFFPPFFRWSEPLSSLFFFSGVGIDSSICTFFFKSIAKCQV